MLGYGKWEAELEADFCGYMRNNHRFHIIVENLNFLTVEIHQGTHLEFPYIIHF